MLSTHDALDASLAPARVAMRWTLACAALVAALGLAFSGPDAAAGALVGGAAGIVGGWSMLLGLSIAFAKGDEPESARRRAVAAALLRYPVIAAILALGIFVLDVPAGWLFAGVSAWPAALAASALHAREADAAPSRG